MEATQLEGPDLVLLMLLAPGAGPASENRVNGITRLEKLLFLADRESPLPSLVSDPLVFKPYNYGPYSKAIYEAVDLLEDVGLVREEFAVDGRALDAMEAASVTAESVDGVERRFHLTQDGVLVARRLADAAPQLTAVMQDVKKRFDHLSLRELIQYVYRRYPEYAAESLIRDRFL